MRMPPRLQKLRRPLRWIGIISAVAVVLAAIPVIWTETQCMLPKQAAAAPPSLLAPTDRREEVNTYLTYPEWSIVHAYEDLAAVTRATSESDFAYVSSIRQFWSSLCSISKVASSRGTISGEYKVMLYTIGLSFAGEMGIKGLYEKTFGRVTSWLAGGKKTPEDTFALALADDYAKFLRQVPWYEYPFGQKLWHFWRDTPLWGGNIVRKIERRIALTLEWGAKSLYAKVIAVGAAATPAPLRIKSAVAGLTPADLAADTRIKLIEQRGDVGIIETDRYATLTSIIRGLAARGRNFTEIAGNQNIMVTVFSKSPTLPEGVGAALMFSVPVASKPDSYRLVLDVKVTALTELLRTIDRAGLELDHVYDY